VKYLLVERRPRARPWGKGISAGMKKKGTRVNEVSRRLRSHHRTEAQQRDHKVVAVVKGKNKREVKRGWVDLRSRVRTVEKSRATFLIV